MNKEFENIIVYCSKFESSSYDKILKIYNFTSEEKLTLNNIFMNPLNHFAILTKKILKHDNNRVKKYFVKFFCKLNCINSNFQHFVFNCFFKLINIPGFYNETDNITYHSKIGIIVQKFFEVFLETNKEVVILYLFRSMISYVIIYLLLKLESLIEEFSFI